MILLDTHVVLWWATADTRLSARATRELARSDSLLVSVFSCWEISTLVRKERFQLDRDVYDWIADLFDQDRVAQAPLSPEIAVSAGRLPSPAFPGDPTDRFIYSTARELAVPLVTKDEHIREYARKARDVRTIW